MKIKVPFVYEALIIKKRCRKPSVVSVRDFVDVTIREIPRDQMPVAIRAENEEYRWFDDALWVPSRLNARGELSESVSMTTLIQNTELSTNYRFSCATAEAPFKYFWRYVSESMAKRHGVQTCCLVHDLNEVNYHNKNAVACRAWLDDNRQVMVDQAVNIAKNRVVLDGIVHVKAGEPRYVLHTFGLGNNHAGIGTALLISTYYNNNIGHDRYFSALNYRAACESADAVASQRGDTRSMPVRAHSEIEVLLPEAVRVSPQNEHGEGCDFINAVESGVAAGGPIGGLVAAVAGIAAGA